ncbi:tyrosine-type recombinase/integrase [Salinicoccus carnicancri]|uniref:tyrosine-type recombinase/integrase n=1 Tax=Salinicoccus carnicancri TaxID=558170 RepID=UPI0002E950E2|nr:tyrosine-type recombinase/integrase [Salinicoccus carnicancri]
MNFVEPIRNTDMIEAILKHLKNKNERDYIMFLIGIYSGLRISDILQLRVEHIHTNDIRIREKKTGKQRKIVLNRRLKGPLLEYIEGKDSWEYLIKSREGFNQPIRRDRAYRIVKDLENYFRMDAVGTHTLRKTFGYHYYQATKDVGTLQKIFNHSHPNVTLQYIGIIQDDIDTAMRDFKYTYD